MIDNQQSITLKIWLQAWAGCDYENWGAHLKTGGGGKLINLEGHQWSK